MSLFFAKQKPKQPEKISLLEGEGCSACPLNKNPEVKPSGAKFPLIYVIGSRPQRIEAQTGVPFTDEYGEFFREFLSARNLEEDDLRFGNCIWRVPEDQREPTEFEVSCCRNYVQEDIENSNPLAIFGVGSTALKWFTGETGIAKWRGRRVPVKIGDEHYWFFPLSHPKFVKDKTTPDEKNRSDPQHVTIMDLDIGRALDFIDQERKPYVYSDEDISDIKQNTRYFSGGGEEALQRIERSLQEICKDQTVALDIETTALRPYNKESVILSFAMSSRKGDIAFGYEHPECTWTMKHRKQLGKILFDALSQAKWVVPHNLTFELEWMVHFFGWEWVDGVRWGDTMAQAFVLDERRGMLNLDVLTQLYFGFNLKEKSPIDVANLVSYPIQEVLEYNVLDTAFTLRLFEEQEWEMEYRGGAYRDLYWEQVHRTLSTTGMQVLGVPLNQHKAQQLYKKYSELAEETSAKIAEQQAAVDYHKRYGKYFDPASPDQVGKLLAHVLMLSVPFNAKGNPVTDNDVLVELDHPIVELILLYRRYSKAVSTYLSPVQPDGGSIHDDGMLHPIYNVNLARTGRLSSEDPNIQNWPKHKDQEIRSCIEMPEGHWMVAFDYGGIEARVLAMVSKDENLTEAFKNRYDIHADWAERIFSTDKSKLARAAELNDSKRFKELRYLAKNNWVFAQFYGSSGYACAKSLRLDDKTGEELEKEFWNMFSGVKHWQEESHRQYLENGEIITLTGRHRHGPVEKYNTPLNTQIQSVAGDLLQDAMNRIADKARQEGKMWLHPRIQIHDELIFIVPDEYLEELFEIVPSMMLQVPFDFVNVPLVVEPEMGRNWYELEGAGEYWSDE